jgi:serine protein kinase
MREKYEKMLAVAEEELTVLLKDYLYAAIVGDESAIAELFSKFIDNATALMNKEKVKDPVTEEDVEPDTDFIRAILDTVDVSDYEGFCQKIVNAMHKRAMQRERDKSVEPFTYKTDERLYKALQLFLFEQEKDKINWEALISRKSIDPEGQRRVDLIRQRLIDHHGYCGTCASAVMAHVAGIFKRGERAKKRKDA